MWIVLCVVVVIVIGLIIVLISWFHSLGGYVDHDDWHTNLAVIVVVVVVEILIIVEYPSAIVVARQ